MQNMTLKGLAVSKYGSITKFAEAMNWSYRKASYIVARRQKANADDIEQMAEAFNISVPEEFRQIFFRNQSK